MTNHTDPDRTALGMATLSLLEALILTLRAKGHLTEEELDAAFDASIAAHANAHGAEHAQAAEMLQPLRVEGNAVRLDA